MRSQPGQLFSPITPLDFPWVSPILKIRFELFDNGLAVFYPDGEQFKEPGEFIDERDQAQRERDQAQQERDLAFDKLRELGVDPSQL